MQLKTLVAEEAKKKAAIAFRAIKKEVMSSHPITDSDLIAIGQYAQNFVMYNQLNNMMEDEISIGTPEAMANYGSLAKHRKIIAEDMGRQKRDLGLGVNNRRTIKSSIPTGEDCRDIIEFNHEE